MNYNHKVALLVCLVGLMAAVLCQSQEAPSQTGATQTPAQTTGDSMSSEQPEMEGEMSYDGEYDDEDDYDYEDDDEDYDEEEELAELAEEHFEVRTDCARLKAMIREAQKNNATGVDPELQQASDDCQEYLKELEEEMAEVTEEIKESEEAEEQQ